MVVIYFSTVHVKVFEGEIIESMNTHGTGCSYSAAITAGLSKG